MPSHKVHFYYCLVVSCAVYFIISATTKDIVHRPQSVITSIKNSISKYQLAMQAIYSHVRGQDPNSNFIPWRQSGNISGDLPAEIRKGNRFLWQRTYPRHARVDSCKQCFKYEYQNLIVPHVCDGLARVDVMLLITTVPSAVEQREVIRNTWGSWSKGMTGNISRHIFMFGSGWNKVNQAIIDSEATTYGDIQQDDYIDSYFNLSLKVLGGYHWFRNHCHLAQFVVRSADDNFVNVPNLIELVTKQKKRLQHVIVGQCYRHSAPIRSVSSKWYVMWEEYPKTKFPPYCVGTTFITSNQLTHEILDTSPNVPFFLIEDVYFGMVVRNIYRKARRGVLSIPGFDMKPHRSLRRKVDKCPYRKTWMAIHKVPPRLFENYWHACSNVTLV